MNPSANRLSLSIPVKILSLLCFASAGSLVDPHQEPSRAQDVPPATDRPATDRPATDRGVLWLVPVDAGPPPIGDPLPAARSGPADRPTGGRWYPPVLWSSPVIIDRFDQERITYVIDDHGPADASGDADDADTNRSGPLVAASERVVWVQSTSASETERVAAAAAAAEDHEAALRAWLSVLRERPPVWHQQWVSMAGAQAAMRASRGEIALEIVRQLDQRPLPPTAIAWLPVRWSVGGLPDPALSRVAADGMSDASPAVRLVAASWSATTQRGVADAVLRTLAANRQRRDLSRLAPWLQLRYVDPDYLRTNRDKLLRRLADLPLALQTGPRVLLADRFAAAGMDDVARTLRLSLEVTPIIPHPDVPASLDRLLPGG